MDNDTPPREATEAVWAIIERKATRVYPSLNYMTIAEEARKAVPGLTVQLFNEILLELEESRRVTCERPLGPAAEIERIFE